MSTFSINQLVKGKHYGVFKVAGFGITASGVQFYRLWCVNPANHDQVDYREEVRLPADCLVAA